MAEPWHWFLPREAQLWRRRVSWISPLFELDHQPCQIHFRVAGLEAALHRLPDPALAVGMTTGFQEQLRVSTELCDRSEGDGMDAVLDLREAAGRKPHDPMRKRAHETPEILRRQRAIDPA